jgi:putative membrane protein
MLPALNLVDWLVYTRKDRTADYARCTLASLRNILLRILLVAAAVMIASALFRPQLSVESIAGALIFALVLGVLNTVVRPILVILTFPLTLLTLGLFLFVVNALMFWLASLVPGVGVDVNGFGGAFLGALTVTVVSFIGSRVLDVD